MEIFQHHAPWYVAGPLLGIAVLGMLWTSNQLLGAFGGYVDTVAWLHHPNRRPSWRMFFFVGMIAGGFLSLVASGGSSAGFAYGTFDLFTRGSLPVKAGMLLVAGLVMGYGARTAGGCTSGHGICGTSMGSPASWISTATFMGTAVVSANLIAFLTGVSR